MKVIETLCDPIRLIAKPGVEFEPGMVVKLSELKDGTPVCDIGDEKCSIGISDSLCLARKKVSYKKENMVRVWTSRMIFRTTRYDTSSKFKPGGPVYVLNGYLTATRPFEDAPYVGRVTKVPEAAGEQLECLWL